jgi:hypothetical protein
VSKKRLADRCKSSGEPRTSLYRHVEEMVAAGVIEIGKNPKGKAEQVRRAPSES